MMTTYIEEEVIVHPINGMQLSEGYIRQIESAGYIGRLPGLAPTSGKTREAVRTLLELEAKEYYGNDVIVEISNPQALAS